MRIYLAGPYCARDFLRGVAQVLEEQGYTVTSSWLRETHAIHPGTEGAAPDMSDGYAQTHAGGDLDDIRDADTLVVFTAEWLERQGVQGRMHSGGRHVETGYALALDKLVLVVGRPENIFHRGVCVTVRNMDSLMRALVRANHDLHEHDWADATELADPVRTLVCAVEGCDATREEPHEHTWRRASDFGLWPRLEVCEVCGAERSVDAELAPSAPGNR